MPRLAHRLPTYYERARHRATRRKSPWNLILIPLCGGSILAAGYASFSVVWVFHTLLYPNHELREFWRDGISFRAFVPSFLMVFAQTPGSIAAGLMLGNLLARLIPPARRAFDAEAQGFPGTSFQSAMRDLFGVLVWTLPIGLAIALAAAYSLESLR